ncbi:16253_t:CDS:1, partial [Cetraspora pellucida]
MFSRYDIKTHSDISNKVQEARLLLASSSKPEIKFNYEDLEAICKKLQNNITEEPKKELGKTATNAILN